MKISATFTLAILIGSFLYPQSTRAASVTLTPLTGVGRLHGINRANQAVGYSLGGDTPDSFIYDKGNRTPIEIRNGTGVQVYGIENNGRAVGKYYEYEPANKGIVKTHGFLYFHGDVTPIDFPGATFTACWGINDPQRIVGYYKNNNGNNRAFFFDKKDYIAIPQPSGHVTDSYATAINNPGDIVGFYTTPDDNPDSDGQVHEHKHGFLYDKNGNLTTIDVPFVGVTDTFCYGINSSGVIVGAYIDANGTYGFVDIAGVFLSVDAPDTPPGVGTSVQGIDDNGQLTVFGTTAFLGNIVQ